MIKLKEILSIEAPISSKLRVHLSATPIDKLYPRDVTQGNEPVTKPNGLWYGFGRDWIDFQRIEIDNKSGKYIYFVKVKNINRILRITNRDEMKVFVDKYYVKPAINWSVVAKDWAGIEINPFLGKLYYDGGQYAWYGTWDIASGCVWDTSTIELKLIYPKNEA